MFRSTNFDTHSIQLYHLNLEGGHCELASPDPSLKEYLDYYWLLTVNAPTLELEVIPDTALDLVLSPSDDQFAALYFPVNEKFYIPLTGPIQYAGICFKAATATEVLGQDLSELRTFDAGLDTVNTLNIQPLTTSIRNVAVLAGFRPIFDQFWLNRLEIKTQEQDNKKSKLDNRTMMSLLENSVGTANIQNLCTALDISERQFRRLSNDKFGLSPKKLQNVLRLQAALAELLACDQHQLQDLYYDDSQRIRELKRLTGFTPGQIRRMAENYNQP